MIKVFSHPRSGTHFLEAFIAANFYKDQYLSVPSFTWGHWANRQVNENGNAYGQLFGGHHFADARIVSDPTSKIYIYRDPRAVAYSIWKTDNFLHPSLKNISLSDFLRTDLDWDGSPGTKCSPMLNIARHWYHHVNSWHNECIPNLLLIRYEDLKQSPEIVFQAIMQKYFSGKRPEKRNVKKAPLIIDKPVGILPNAASIDAWKNHFHKEDLDFFHAQIPDRSYFRL